MQRSIDDNNDFNGRCDFDDNDDSYITIMNFFKFSVGR